MGFLCAFSSQRGDQGFAIVRRPCRGAAIAKTAGKLTTPPAAVNARRILATRRDLPPGRPRRHRAPMKRSMTLRLQLAFVVIFVLVCIGLLFVHPPNGPPPGADA